MGGHTESGVDHNGDIRLFQNDFQHGAGTDALSASDRCGKRHDGVNSDILQSFRKDRVGIDIRQNDKAFVDENFRRFQSFDRIREKVIRVGVDFQLDPFVPGAFSEFGDAHRFFRSACTAGIEHDLHFCTVDSGEDVIAGVGEVDAAERNGDQFAAGGADGVGEGLGGREFSGSEEQAASELPPGDYKFFLHDCGISCF